MAVGDPDQSIYSFRGADIRNILEFERDFPNTKVIPLEQNYRSTNTILQAANARDREQPRAQGEAPLVGPRRGRAGARRRDRGRARRGAVRRRRDRRRWSSGGYSAGEIAVVYRTNAQSRVLEDVLVRQGVAYQVIGGPRFYERAEIKDAIAYLQVIDNPYDAVSLMRIANRPRRGIGDTSLARLVRVRGRSRHLALGGDGDSRRRGARAAAARAVTGFRNVLESLMATATDATCATVLEAVLERTGYVEALEAERTIEARGRIENLEELVGVAREYEQASAGAVAVAASCRRSRSTRTRTRCATARTTGGKVTLMTIHNAKGLEYPRGVHARDGGDGLPARALDRGEPLEEERRLCYVGMTRAKERLTMTHAMRRSLFGRSEANLPSRFLDELPSIGVERERLRPASWSDYGEPRAARAEYAPRADVPDLSTGDTVRHGTLGTGIVTRIEAGGVVTVRFEDGAERRLMLEYAPLERVG